MDLQLSGLRALVTGQTTCNSAYNLPCAGKFTPFTGKRLAGADVDHDGKADVAVVADHAIAVNGSAASSVQFAIGCPQISGGAALLLAIHVFSSFRLVQSRNSCQ